MKKTFWLHNGGLSFEIASADNKGVDISDSNDRISAGLEIGYGTDIDCAISQLKDLIVCLEKIKESSYEPTLYITY